MVNKQTYIVIYLLFRLVFSNSSMLAEVFETEVGVGFTGVWEPVCEIYEECEEPKNNNPPILPQTGLITTHNLLLLGVIMISAVLSYRYVVVKLKN